MNWTKINKELPPPGVCVWVKRFPNKADEKPMYLAVRQDQPIATNPDPSTCCYWSGIKARDGFKANQNNNGIRLEHSFSDVTVDEWAFLEPPIY